MNLKIGVLIIGLLTTYFSMGQTILFSGKITNPIGEEVFLKQHTQEDGERKTTEVASAKLEGNGTFFMKFELEQLSELTFSDGNEQTIVLVEPGDELYLTLNTKMFDETISFTGKGAAKNNAVIDCYMIEEVATNIAWNYGADIDTTVIFKDIENSFDALKSVVKDYMGELKSFSEYGENYYKRLEMAEKQIKKSIVKNRIFQERVQELISTEAVSIKGVGIDGEEVTLRRFKGKTIIIDFWAPWCGPCRSEMPAFKELETRYGNDVNFVSIGVFCKEDKWRTMAKELGFENNIFLDKEAGSQIKLWQVNFIPRYIVIDKNFKIVNALAPRPSSGDLEVLIKELNPDI